MHHREVAEGNNKLTGPDAREDGWARGRRGSALLPSAALTSKYPLNAVLPSSTRLDSSSSILHTGSPQCVRQQRASIPILR